MKKENGYIIKGGAEGKQRLDILSGILNEHSLSLIEKDTPLQGKRFLELGCGGGNLALAVAEKIGNGGKVTAIDFDEEILALAKVQANENLITNISFIAMDASEIAFENEYDIVYSRFLLSHLKEPNALIGKMIRALKPGGKLVVEDIDFSGHFSYPHCTAFETYQRLFITAASNNGQNPNIGLSLFSMLKESGLQETAYEVFQPSHHTGNGKWMAYNTMDRIKESVLKQQLATSEEIKQILNELNIFTQNDDSILSLPRIFGTWGYKQ